MWEHTSNSLGFTIKRLVHEYRDRVALIHYEGFHRQTYTFRDFYTLTHTLSCHLYARGLRKGDRVMVWAPNGAHWILAYLVAAYSGITLVPVDILASSTFAQKIYQRTKPKLVLAEKELLDRLELSSKEEGMTLQFFKRLARTTPPPQDSDALVAVTGHDLLEIVFTSGTTSEPKGILIRQHQVVANTQAVRRRIIYHDSWKFLSLLPMSHLFEQVIGLLGPIYFGATIVAVSSRSMPELFALGRKEGVTHIATVPAVLDHLKIKILEKLPPLLAPYLDPASPSHLLERLYKLPFYLRRLLSWPIRRKIGKWQGFICGGAALDRSTQLFWEALGIRVVVGYGMTEAAPIITCNSMDVRPLGSVGHGLSGQLIKIASDGEILVAGENLSTGYFEQQERAHCNPQGWFHTGDVGHLDAKGRMWITGRKKEMIVRKSGMNVFPYDIESRLNQEAMILESLVLSDPQNQQDLLALVTLHDEAKNAPLLEEQLHEVCSRVNAELEPHQRLGRIAPWPKAHFEKTHTLKLKRAANAELYRLHLQELERQNKGLHATFKKEGEQQHPIFELLAQISSKKLPSIHPSSHLSHDLGLDSVDQVTLWMQIEARLKVSLPTEKMEEIVTVEQLIEAIEDQRKRPQVTRQKYFYFHAALLQLLREPLFLLMRLLISLFWRIEQQGIVATPSKRAPLIYVANHASHLDSLAIATTLPSPLRRATRFAAAYDHFFCGLGRLRGLLMQLFLGAFGFHRHRDIFDNMRTLQELFSTSHPLVLFPEGTRSRNGVLGDFKPGIGLIVSHFEARVQPIYIEGTHALWPPGKKLPRGGTVKIHYMEPIDFPPNTPPSTITRSLEENYKNWAKRYGAKRPSVSA